MALLPALTVASACVFAVAAQADSIRADSVQADGVRADSVQAAAPADGSAAAGADLEEMPQPSVKPQAPDMVGVCRGQRFIGQRVACYSDLAVRAGDPTLCFQAADPDVRWPCVAKYAVVAGDADTCRLLPGPPGGDTAADATPGGDASVTVDLCLSTLALVYRRPELCRQLATAPMDDACLAKLVANGADPALCATVKSPGLKDVCRPDPLQEIRE